MNKKSIVNTLSKAEETKIFITCDHLMIIDIVKMNVFHPFSSKEVSILGRRPWRHFQRERSAVVTAVKAARAAIAYAEVVRPVRKCWRYGPCACSACTQTPGEFLSGHDVLSELDVLSYWICHLLSML